MIKRFLRHFAGSVRAKLIVTVAFPVLGVVLFTAVYYPVQQRAEVLDRIDDQVATLSEMLALSAGVGIGEGSLSFVKHAFDWARDGEDVAYVAILDTDGSALALHDPNSLNLAEDASFEEGVVRERSGLVATKLPVTYEGERYGSVVVAYSLGGANAAVRKGVLVSLLINALLLAFGIALAVVSAGRLSREIIALRNAARAVGEGRLDVRLSLKSEDEIGELGAAFAQMVNRIKAGHEALKAEKAAVEHKVEDAVRASQEQQEYLLRTVRTMLDGITRFEQGDLTVQLAVERDDVMGALFSGFNKAAENLRQMLRRLHTVVEQTADATAEINASSDHLAISSQKQSAQAEEVALSVDEMVRSIVDNARSAAQAAGVAEANGKAASEGGRVVEMNVDKMRQIATIVSDSASTVERLGASSRHIGEIVQVIDEIADQTNLLALNAAIEAARAGEQGRGFAVVADEVRKLAERTTKATKEIAQMIKTIQDETSEAVHAMRRGNEEVAQGLTLADQAGTALRRIVEGTDRTIDVVSRIAAANEQQSSTSEQIARSVEGISAISSEAASGIGNIARSTGSLEQLTETLRTLIARFNTGSAPASRVSPDNTRSRQSLLQRSFADPEAV